MSKQNNQQQPTGFNCPVCSGFVPVSMLQLLNAENILCPNCGLEIRINEEGSKRAIDALNKVHEAEINVKKASVFGK